MELCKYFYSNKSELVLVEDRAFREVKLEVKDRICLYKPSERLENSKGLAGKLLKKCMQKAKTYTTDNKKK